MMMPANYSAIAETEMTYVVGGDSLFPAFNPLSTLFTNIVNIIGNNFLQPVVDNTLGVVFGGKYQFGNVFKGIGGKINTAYGAVLEKDEKGDVVGGQFNGVLNAGAQILGGMAAVAQLMNNDVKPATAAVVKFNKV